MAQKRGRETDRFSGPDNDGLEAESPNSPKAPRLIGRRSIQDVLAAAKVGAVVLDIDGTTSSSLFVLKVLYPLTLRLLPAFLRDHCSDGRVRSLLDRLCSSVRSAGSNSCPQNEQEKLLSAVPWNPAACDRIADVLVNAMSFDRLRPALKELQGMIWQSAYENGEVRGHVFDDVPFVLERWRAQGIPVYTFSNGSAAAQRLLFRYSSFGDLTPLIKDFFDTARFGPKTEMVSYENLARELGLPPASVVFISDDLQETDAAAAAGYRVILSVRPGNKPTEQSDIDNRNIPVATNLKFAMQVGSR